MPVVKPNYDPTDRAHAYDYLETHRMKGEVVTGLLYVEKDGRDFHALNKTVNDPLVSLNTALDGKAILEQVQARYR